MVIKVWRSFSLKALYNFHLVFLSFQMLSIAFRFERSSSDNYAGLLSFLWKSIELMTYKQDDECRKIDVTCESFECFEGLKLWKHKSNRKVNNKISSPLKRYIKQNICNSHNFTHNFHDFAHPIICSACNSNKCSGALSTIRVLSDLHSNHMCWRCLSVNDGSELPVVIIINYESLSCVGEQ